MSRFARALLPFIATALVVVSMSCSNSDGPASPGGGSSSSLSGQFYDSVVQGLDYTSGATSGLTDATGKFKFEKNTDVAFAVGPIAIGSGPPASIMTPLDLVLGALGVTNATVTNLARFLQTIDDDGNPANGIVITSAIHAAAAGQSVNFQQDIASFESDANVQSVVTALTTASQAGERTLISAATAQSNLSGAISAAYAGSYTGNFCRDGGQGHSQTTGGTWQMDVAADGSVLITFSGNPSFTMTGTMSASGSVTLNGTNATGYAEFNPDLGGRWYYAEQSGSFSESTNCGH